MKSLVIGLTIVSVLLLGCSNMNKSKKGAVIGTATGGAIGGAIGSTQGKVVLGSIIGATIGGVVGAVIGHNMDKQAEEMKKNLPDATVERVGEGIVIEFNNKILFGFDQSDLSSGARANLDKLVDVLQKYPDTDIEVQGHTDNTGSAPYNLALSQRRASSVTDYLITNSITSSRISMKAFGESEPKYSNATSEGQDMNRRVDFVISANEKMKADAAKESNNSGGR
ncbi:MAG: OmpA family protein [Chitinophagaceae bacterium]